MRTGGACRREPGKVEQTRNSVFHPDIWNGNMQPPPKAICGSFEKNVNLQPAAPHSSRELILKPVCTSVAEHDPMDV